ncbi:hypothetical protein BLNAU_9868 [Blattamonas nauphoetae]|uniref:Uncharacterized protein n=1 Tax=Blattamonas nauphoetae TaxID=2049346 RepID=A0ABQ9XUI3_9EUKA|nr:hypothetical protein BLNAU_9868 [Blattamonas nauphoetae]
MDRNCLFAACVPTFIDPKGGEFRQDGKRGTLQFQKVKGDGWDQLTHSDGSAKQTPGLSDRPFSVQFPFPIVAEHSLHPAPQTELVQSQFPTTQGQH